MADKEWAIPPAAQPDPHLLAFDLDQALASVLAVRSEVPADAFTASILGTERAGSGILIDRRGLVLTIGYLVTEAESIWLTTADSGAVAGHVMAYDQATGFGLVQALTRLDLPPLEIGSADDVEAGDHVILAGHGGRQAALDARVAGKREFAGYWEYLLNEAIFTTPAHPNWGGAACLDQRGRLIGVGSLLIQHEQNGEEQANGNMVVPIDLLPPILDDLTKFGQVSQPPRPWLGMYTADTQSHPVVVGLAEPGPAAKAGVEVGDVVLEVDDAPVDDLAGMLRRVWSLGDAGVDVPLKVMREGQIVHVRVRSADRASFLKRPMLH
ncbi:MAG: S1C family serine protease [Geminicoccaceae bacterium]|nr:S1C family serine protease [Geminicoccaceae bacterium]